MLSYKPNQKCFMLDEPLDGNEGKLIEESSEYILGMATYTELRNTTFNKLSSLDDLFIFAVIVCCASVFVIFSKITVCVFILLGILGIVISKVMAKKVSTRYFEKLSELATLFFDSLYFQTNNLYFTDADLKGHLMQYKGFSNVKDNIIIDFGAIFTDSDILLRRTNQNFHTAELCIIKDVASNHVLFTKGIKGFVKEVEVTEDTTTELAVIISKLKSLEGYNTNKLLNILEQISKVDGITDKSPYQLLVTKYVPLLNETLDNLLKLKKQGVAISDADDRSMRIMFEKLTIAFEHIHTDLYADASEECFVNARVISQLLEMDGLL